MKLSKSPTYYKSLEIYAVIAERGGVRSATFEQLNGLNYSQQSTGQETFHLLEELTVVNRGVLRSLSPRALKIALVVMDELKRNNALWYFDASTNSRDRVALKELRDKEILYKTEEPHIFYINPLRIRNGSAASVVARTTHLLSTVSRVHRELIKDLTGKTAIQLDHFDVIMNKLSENEAQYG